MACQFVPLSNDASGEPRVTLRDPTQHEEGCSSARFNENVEQMLGISLDSPRQCFPTASINYRRKRLDLEIILDVNR